MIAILPTPNEHAARVTDADLHRLEVIEAVLHETEGEPYDQRAQAAHLSPRAAAARMRAARAGHPLPPGVSIRDLMT